MNLIQLFLIIISIIIIRHKNSLIIKQSNIIYMISILFGLFFQSFTIYTYIGKSSHIQCQLRKWLVFIPLTFIVMTIFYKVKYFFNH